MIGNMKNTFKTKIKLVVDQKAIFTLYCKKLHTLTVPPEMEEVAKLYIKDPGIAKVFKEFEELGIR
jgi:hypothetical protein